MTATGHALIGAAIVTIVPDLRISLPLVLLSHVLGDLPEHWDTGTNWRQKGLRKVFIDSIFDLLASYALVLTGFVLILKVDPARVLLGAFVSQLPDFLEVPYFFFHWRFAPWTWINDIAHLFHKKYPQFNLTLANQLVIGLTLFIIAWAIH